LKSTPVLQSEINQSVNTNNKIKGACV
jgi:hypothetical protein